MRKLEMCLVCTLVLSAMCVSLSFAQDQVVWNGALGPFVRADGVNPIIIPNEESLFRCPVQDKVLAWAGEHAFNPGAVVYNEKIYLFYRAEDNFGVGIAQHTSRIGMAVSEDGLHFQSYDSPVLYPDFDDQYENEWPGGCEDPRVVEREDGTFVMLYTQWNRKMPVLAVATSTDLTHWKKHGYAFERAAGGAYGRRSCKSGAVVCALKEERLVATKIKDKYWMYWGEGNIHIAISNDLISWEPFLDEEVNPTILLKPRSGKFDSRLVEAGPPAVLTKDGIVLLYNGKNCSKNGDPRIGAKTYAAGQLLFDAEEPTRLLARTDDWFFKPERSFETSGQYEAGTVFVQGLVYFQNKWFLYYGAADSVVGVAVSEKE